MTSMDLLSLRSEGSRPLRICIVGAGIAGLSAAICLGNAGHDVSVFESSSHLKEIGAGIQVGPSECASEFESHTTA
jgi:salicylate hydroxylase